MLEFKKISEDTVRVMQESMVDSVDYYEDTVNSINEIIPSSEVFILNSANSCLITVCESIPDPVLVCDMGGWNGFIRSCDLFGKKVEYLATDDALINIKLLEDYLREHDIKSLYVTSLAGYTALQPLNEIKRLCDVYDVMLIVDISGTVGCKKINNIGDIQVASTGSPKIVNIENGGFICNITGKIRLNKHLIKSLKADNITCAGIKNEISKSPQILEKTIKINKYLKDKLVENNINILHKNSPGINTIILMESKSRAKKLAYNIKKNLALEKNIVTVGPNYNRVKKPSVNIEIKNLNIEKITLEDIDYIANIIINEKNSLEDMQK